MEILHSIMSMLSGNSKSIMLTLKDSKFSYSLDSKMVNNNVLTFQNNSIRSVMVEFRKSFQWVQSEPLFKKQHQWDCLIKFWIKNMKFHSSNFLWEIWETLFNMLTNFLLMTHYQFLAHSQMKEQVI